MELYTAALNLSVGCTHRMRVRMDNIIQMHFLLINHITPSLMIFFFHAQQRPPTNQPPTTIITPPTTIIIPKGTTKISIAKSVYLTSIHIEIVQFHWPKYDLPNHPNHISAQHSTRWIGCVCVCVCACVWDEMCLLMPWDDKNARYWIRKISSSPLFWAGALLWKTRYLFCFQYWPCAVFNSTILFSNGLLFDVSSTRIHTHTHTCWSLFMLLLLAFFLFVQPLIRLQRWTLLVTHPIQSIRVRSEMLDNNIYECAEAPYRNAMELRSIQAQKTKLHLITFFFGCANIVHTYNA